MRAHRLAVTAGLAALALSGASLGQGSTPTYTKYGIFTLNQMTAGEDTTRMANGFFLAPPQAISNAPGAAAPSSDSCFLMSESQDQPGASIPGPPGEASAASANFLDAGPQLTIRNSSQALASVPRQTLNAGPVKLISYTEPDLPELTGALVLDIPGANPGFPKMTGVPFPAAPAELKLKASTPTDAITKATTFTWSGANTKNSLVSLSGTGSSAGRDVSFNCIFVDDGQAGFPAATQAQMDKMNFTDGTLLTATRTASSSHAEADAIVVINLSQTISFEE